MKYPLSSCSKLLARLEIREVSFISIDPECECSKLDIWLARLLMFCGGKYINPALLFSSSSSSIPASVSGNSPIKWAPVRGNSRFSWKEKARIDFNLFTKMKWEKWEGKSFSRKLDVRLFLPWLPNTVWLPSWYAPAIVWLVYYHDHEAPVRQ